MARAKVRKIKPQTYDGTPAPLPRRIVADAKLICRDPEFLRQLHARAWWHRNALDELKKHKLLKHDAKATLDYYIDALEAVVTAGNWLPSKLFVDLHVAEVERAGRSFRTHAEEAKIAGHVIRRALAAADEVRNNLGSSFRARSPADARRDFMYLMSELFVRYDATIPRNQDAPEIRLCHDIAQWCGDPGAPSAFVRAIPNYR